MRSGGRRLLGRGRILWNRPLGRSSGEWGAYRAARALADAIGVELTYFEGGHGGFGASDEAFAQKPEETLTAQRAA